MNNQQQYIRELQGYLRALAAEDNRIPAPVADGIYGPQTRESVRIFQQLNGLPATGEVDRDTWEAIYRRYMQLPQSVAPAERIMGIPPHSDMNGDDLNDSVRLIQTMINALSRKYSNIPAVPNDGIFDDATAAAVRQFQQLASLPVTGDVDMRTWNYLAREFNRLTGAAR